MRMPLERDGVVERLGDDGISFSVSLAVEAHLASPRRHDAG